MQGCGPNAAMRPKCRDAAASLHFPGNCPPVVLVLQGLGQVHGAAVGGNAGNGHHLVLVLLQARNSIRATLLCLSSCTRAEWAAVLHVQPLRGTRVQLQALHPLHSHLPFQLTCSSFQMVVVTTTCCPASQLRTGSCSCSEDVPALAVCAGMGEAGSNVLLGQESGAVASGRRSRAAWLPSSAHALVARRFKPLPCYRLHAQANRST